MDLPHFGCYNHEVAFDVNCMFRYAVQKRTIYQIRNTTRECNSSVKNRCMLQRLTSLAPVLPGATRWSGLCQIVQRFSLIPDELEQVADTEGPNLSIGRDTSFRENSIRLESYMKEIDFVTRSLKTHGLLLTEARFLCDSLFKTVKSQYSQPDAPLYLCKFKDVHSSKHSSHSPDSNFESGVYI